MEKDFALNLLTKTWTRDSHGLFDYESQQIKPHEGTLVNNSMIIRKKMEIKLAKTIHDKKEDEEFLLEIKVDENCMNNFLITYISFY